VWALTRIRCLCVAPHNLRVYSAANTKRSGRRARASAWGSWRRSEYVRMATIAAPRRATAISRRHLYVTPPYSATVVPFAWLLRESMETLGEEHARWTCRPNASGKDEGCEDEVERVALLVEVAAPAGDRRRAVASACRECWPARGSASSLVGSEARGPIGAAGAGEVQRQLGLGWSLRR
jgi:hypothetical protein